MVKGSRVGAARKGKKKKVISGAEEMAYLLRELATLCLAPKLMSVISSNSFLGIWRSLVVSERAYTCVHTYKEI